MHDLTDIGAGSERQRERGREEERKRGRERERAVRQGEDIHLMRG